MRVVSDRFDSPRGSGENCRQEFAFSIYMLSPSSSTLHTPPPSPPLVRPYHNCGGGASSPQNAHHWRGWAVQNAHQFITGTIIPVIIIAQGMLCYFTPACLIILCAEFAQLAGDTAVLAVYLASEKQPISASETLDT